MSETQEKKSDLRDMKSDIQEKIHNYEIMSQLWEKKSEFKC